ncbi:MAG: fumarylacetoacetate hydrolase family protein [Lachnospiraceae bacterium]|nr:fumarylacetoacetate hydrolase family protein [Lachnospiraceae bacterium]
MVICVAIIVTTGGVGMGFNPPKFLQPGDVVKCSIKEIGELINKVDNNKYLF